MAIGSNLRTVFSPDATPKHPDRRESPRYDMSGAVYLLSDGVDPVKIGTVRDISLRGAFVASQEDLPTDRLLRMQFKVGADFEMSGHVCRKDRNGFAVAFREEEATQES